jgi:excisionase family DNA binding protein
MKNKRRREYTIREMHDFLGRFKRDVIVTESRRARAGKKVSRGQVAKDWLPFPEAAKLLSVTRRQVYDLVRAGRLRAEWVVWPGGYRVKWVTRQSVERYARQRYA